MAFRGILSFDLPKIKGSGDLFKKKPIYKTWIQRSYFLAIISGFSSAFGFYMFKHIFLTCTSESVEIKF